MDAERAGKKGKLTTARSGAKTAQNDGFRAEGRGEAPASAVACSRRKTEARRGGKWGRERSGERVLST